MMNCCHGKVSFKMMGRVTAARQLQQRALTNSHLVSSSIIHHYNSSIIPMNKSCIRSHSLLPTQQLLPIQEASSPMMTVRHFSTPQQPPSSKSITDTPNKAPDDTTTTNPESEAPSTEVVLDTSTLLDAFRDPLRRGERMEHTVGRSWHARQLRRKSFDDLHKLWYILYKERNMLLTEQHLSRRHQLQFPQPERLRKVRKSMGAIKQVLGERKRTKIAACAERQEQAMMNMMEEEDEEWDYKGEDEDEDEGEDTTMDVEHDAAEQNMEDRPQEEAPNKDPKS